MRKIFIVALAALAVASCSQSFTFVQISDTQLGFYEKPAGTFVRTEKMLNHAVDEFNASKPAFVIMTGDMCDFADNKAEYDAFVKATARLNPDIPLYKVSGNHDIQDGYSKAQLEEYRKKFGDEKFAFKYKGCSFIGFDSCCIKYDGDDAAEAEALQYAWLRQRLTEAQGSRFIFLFCHHPVIYGEYNQPEDYSNFPERLRKKYFDLFREFHVTAVFSGHTHHPMYTEYKGVSYHICGSSGTTFENSPSGYHVVKVGKDEYDVKFTAIANQENQ